MAEHDVERNVEVQRRETIRQVRLLGIALGALQDCLTPKQLEQGFPATQFGEVLTESSKLRAAGMNLLESIGTPRQVLEVFKNLIPQGPQEIMMEDDALRE